MIDWMDVVGMAFVFTFLALIGAVFIGLHALCYLEWKNKAYGWALIFTLACLCFDLGSFHFIFKHFFGL